MLLIPPAIPLAIPLGILLAVPIAVASAIAQAPSGASDPDALLRQGLKGAGDARHTDTSAPADPARPEPNEAGQSSLAAPVRQYAVVVAGRSGAPLDKGLDWFYWRAISGMYEKLKCKYGYPDESIYCLYEYSSERAEARSIVDGRSTKKSFQAVMKHLSTVMRRGDGLYLFLIDHGNPNATTNLADAPLSATELDEMLDDLPSQNITIVLNYCFGGSWIPHLSQKGRIICTAVSATESDSGWAECFRDAIGGERPKADRNNDKRISVLEAYLETVEHAKSSGGYHPQLEDTGDGKSRHPDDQPGGLRDEGKAAAERFLGKSGAPLEYSEAEKAALRELNAGLSLER